MNSEVNTDTTKENTFFLDGNHSTTSPKPKQERVNEINEIVDYIKEHQPITLWELSKAKGIPNSTLYYKIRDLEFAGLIFSKIVLNDKNRNVRVLYSAKKEDQNGVRP